MRRKRRERDLNDPGVQDDITLEGYIRVLRTMRPWYWPRWLPWRAWMSPWVGWLRHRPDAARALAAYRRRALARRTTGGRG